MGKVLPGVYFAQRFPLGKYVAIVVCVTIEYLELGLLIFVDVLMGWRHNLHCCSELLPRTLSSTLFPRSYRSRDRACIFSDHGNVVSDNWSNKHPSADQA